MAFLPQKGVFLSPERGDRNENSLPHRCAAAVGPGGSAAAVSSHGDRPTAPQ